MSLATATPLSDTGRSRHLAELAMVFRHRHGTWADFGQFLKALFGDAPHNGEIEQVPVHHLSQCRHAPAGRHGGVLLQVAQAPSSYPMFDHERYTRPCFGIGSFEQGKNPGLVMDDVCSKAAFFLRSIGKGDPDETSGRDFEYVPPSGSPPEGRFSQETTDSNSQIDASNIEEGPRDRGSTNTATVITDEDDDYDDSLFDDEDVIAVLAAMTDVVGGDGHSTGGSSIGDNTLSLPAGYSSSQDSANQYTGRSSTKIRVHTLAYLWGFADRPRRLREQFRILRTTPDLWVLHLCGCGISGRGVDGSQNYGCTEKTHLILGSRELNEAHKNHHFTIRYTPADNYARLISALRPNGEVAAGVF